MTFAETEAYPMSGDDAFAIWTSARVPKAHWGYVHLGHDFRYFAVSMFHQLHCVNQIRMNIVEPYGRHASEGHMQHCLTYLRQFFLCGADDTLEPGDFTEKDLVAERVSHTRVCRDWSAVYDSVGENYREWREFSESNGTWTDV